MVLEDWQHRVIVERDELAAKLEKLDSALLLGKVKSQLQIDLMTVQRAAMSVYLKALIDRIADFGAKSNDA